MTMIEEPLFDDHPKVASVRRSDPLPAKEAAASDPVSKTEQWKLLLQRLHDGPISADTAGTIIGKHRSIASSRLGVMAHRGWDITRGVIACRAHSHVTMLPRKLRRP